MRTPLLAALLAPFALSPVVGADSVDTDTNFRHVLPGMVQDEPADDATTTDDLAVLQASRPARYGVKDTWWMTVHGGAGLDVKSSDNVLGLAGVGFNYFLVDDLSLNFDFNGMYFSQEGDDAYGANFALTLRWHFYTWDTVSLYADAGAGLLWTVNDVPEHGSGFNFTPQAGLGVTWQPDEAESMRWMFGVRWHHVSNANLYDENPGRDSIMAYLGVTFPY